MGAIIFNEGQAGTNGPAGRHSRRLPSRDPDFRDRPSRLGNDLAAIEDLELHMFADTTIDSRRPPRTCSRRPRAATPTTS